MLNLDQKATADPTMPPVWRRFLPLMEIGDGCWRWVGAAQSHGYGQFDVRDGRGGFVERRAHRVAYRLYNGPISDGLYVCHKCDNRACVRPDHLFLATQKENVKDCITKGRGNRARGEKQWFSKLTEADVRAIRASTDRPMVLARRYGLNHGAIWSIRSRRTWAWVDDANPPDKGGELD